MKYKVYFGDNEGFPLIVEGLQAEYDTLAEAEAVAKALDVVGLVDRWYIWDDYEEQAVLMKEIK